MAIENLKSTAAGEEYEWTSLYPMQFVGGNHLKLLRNGEEYFPSLVAAIDSASAELFLETYIFADDETGSLVCDALARAALFPMRRN